MADDPAGALDELRRAHDALSVVLAERDAVLARLTVRLLELERGQRAGEDATTAATIEESPGVTAEVVRAAGESARLAEELRRLRATRTFRWTAPGRTAWGRVRTLRRGLPGRLGARARP